jgi:hypothetical protein
MRHRAHGGHRTVRPWWAPWSQRCTCGLPADHPGALETATPVSDGTNSTWAVEQMRGNRPGWDTTTTQLPLPNLRWRRETPLLTRAQASRYRAPGDIGRPWTGNRQ